MSVVRSSGGTKYARATLSGLVAASSRVLISHWLKKDASDTGNAYMMAIGAGSASPHLIVGHNNTANWQMSVNGGIYGGGTTVDDTWLNIIAVFGQWDGSYRNRSILVNGASVSSGTTNPSSSSADMTRLTLFGNNNDSPSYLVAAGKIAEAAVFVDPADEAGLIALLQTQQVTAAALGVTPAWSRRLYNDYTTGQSAGDPVQTGGLTFDTADHPSLSDTAPSSGSARRRATFIM